MQHSFSPEHNEASAFEQLYIGVREKEQRICADEELLQLPLVEKEHPHYKEWMLRKKSTERLMQYLKDKECKLNILEVGCGNGWLAAKLADIESAHVTGLDINTTELNQAERVFKKSNLRFLPIELAALKEHDFDIIVFAASIQYFPSLKDILEIALERVVKGGEIHVLDTHFYKLSEVNDARQRSKQYYAGMGFEKMDAYYFHHAIDELKAFDYRLLFNPHSLVNKLRRSKERFYWICVKNK